MAWEFACTMRCATACIWNGVAGVDCSDCQRSGLQSDNLQQMVLSLGSRFRRMAGLQTLILCLPRAGKDARPLIWLRDSNCHFQRHAYVFCIMEGSAVGYDNLCSGYLLLLYHGKVLGKGPEDRQKGKQRGHVRRDSAHSGKLRRAGQFRYPDSRRTQAQPQK